MEPFSSHEEPVNADPPNTEANSIRSARFRFKSREDQDHLREQDDISTKRRQHHHSASHRHRSKRHKSAHIVGEISHNGGSADNLPPDVAFRESLFDALGDDEGASFWQRVYGQPIHNFPNTYQDESTGELEQMGDDEYAQFVRRKMWEKSWEGIEAARDEKRREQQRAKEKQSAERKRPSHSYDTRSTSTFDFEIENSLKRGQQRKEKKRWRTLWNDYLRSWNSMQAVVQSRNQLPENTEQLFLRNKIAWPVETGKRKDVNHDEVERFFETCIKSQDDDPDLTLSKLLKIERVKWHPDKIQQKYGSMEIDENTLKGVTAVFQVLDQMWNRLRETN